MDVASVFPKIKVIVADVLAVDESEVELKKQLIAELGAESIDFLDLIFQLEREFKIKIPRGQIEKQARGALSDAEFEQGGVITEKGMVVLKEYLSEVPAENFKSGLKVAEIPTLFTVETLCKLVVNAHNQQTETA
ncbi:MAG: acyl carrier protein [Pseudomonadota bacterium]